MSIRWSFNLAKTPQGSAKPNIAGCTQHGRWVRSNSLSSSSMIDPFDDIGSQSTPAHLRTPKCWQCPARSMAMSHCQSTPSAMSLEAMVLPEDSMIPVPRWRTCHQNCVENEKANAGLIDLKQHWIMICIKLINPLPVSFCRCWDPILPSHRHSVVTLWRKLHKDAVGPQRKEWLNW